MGNDPTKRKEIKMKIRAFHENGNEMTVNGDARMINLMRECGYIGIEIEDAEPNWQWRDDEPSESAIQDADRQIHAMPTPSAFTINGEDIIKINRHEVVIWGSAVSIETAAEAIA